MNILIYGVGGIGGFLGAFLLKAGYNVTFLSRGKNYLNLKTNGLILQSTAGFQSYKNIDIISEFKNYKKFDIIIVCVKLYDFDQVIDAIRDNVSKECIVLPFQNGIYSEEILKEKLFHNPLFGAVAQISAHLDNDSRVIHNGKLATFFIGCIFKNKYSKKLQFFSDNCKKFGLDIRYTEKISEKIWDKFIFLSAYSGMTTLTQLTIGQIFENKKYRKMFISAMNETFELTSFFKVNFNYDSVKSWEKKIEKMPYDMTSSMYLDFKNKRKLELDWLSGSVCYYSNKFGINASIHNQIVKGIKLNYSRLT